MPQQLPDRPQDLSLSIMALNAESTIERTLNSVKGHISKVVLIDNGCTDKTVQVALAWCKHHDVDFCLDNNSPLANAAAYIPDTEEFHGINDPQNTGLPMLCRWDEARNLQFKTVFKDHPTYLLILDADDVYHEADQLPMVLHAMDQGADVAYFRYEIVDPQSGRLSEILIAPRLFRKAAYPDKLKWADGPVHETLAITDGQVFVLQNRKFGFIRDMRDNSGGRRINQRNLKILHHHYQKQGGKISPKNLFHLGREALNAGKDSPVFGFARSATEKFLLEKNNANAEWRSEAYITLGQFQELNDEIGLAGNCFQNAIDEYDGVDARLHRARTNHKLGEYNSCIENCKIGLLKAAGPNTSMQGHSEIIVRATFIIYTDALFKTEQYMQCAHQCHIGLQLAPGNQFILHLANQAFDKMSELERKKFSESNIEGVLGTAEPIESSPEK